MRTMLHDLYGHRRWANARMLAMAAAHPFPDVRRLAAHVVATEHLWISRVRDAVPRVAVWPELGLEAMHELERANERDFAPLIRGDAGELARVVAYRNSLGRDYRSAVRDILVHVAMHGQHHRGQIAREVRRGGGTPTPTDFIVWSRRDQD